MMKKKFLAFGLFVAALALGLQSCSNDDDDDYGKLFANAVVTIKPSGDNSQMLIQLDNKTLLTPTNVKTSKYGNKEVRAIANLSDIDRVNNTVFVNWIDSILTKPVAQNYSLRNDSAYGNDPVEIVNSFETVAEDGYLTLRFRTIWGSNKPHRVNLVERTDINHPYPLFQLYHDGNGEKGGRVADGYVAFRLPAYLNQDERDTLTIGLQYRSFAKGEAGDSLKTLLFKYVPRR